MSFTFTVGIGFQPCDSNEPREGEVTLYEHAHYKGKSYTTGHEIGALGIVGLNDKISSVKLGPHTHASLHEHNNYSGRRLDIEHSIDDLSHHGFNDIASSIRVHKK